MKFIDLTGQKFHRLTVVERVKNTGGATMWLCNCDCGKKTEVNSSYLRAGKIKSCGCYRKEACKTASYKHGHAKQGLSGTYRSWANMIQRCTNPAKNQYHNYGGAGITVCDRWRDFQNFLEDMGERPEGCSIDRIDNTGNYEPGNCRWSTDKEQQRNRNNTVYIKYRGKMVKLADLAEQGGVSASCMWNRIFKLKWTVDEAIKTESQRPNPRKRNLNP
jgi:hypothetical protein